PRIFTLSLHDALPIFSRSREQAVVPRPDRARRRIRLRATMTATFVQLRSHHPKERLEQALVRLDLALEFLILLRAKPRLVGIRRSEEHTSELQSRVDL